MANVLVNEQSLTDIAAAIRAKNGEETTYKPGEMAAAISNLPTGGGNLQYVVLTKATDKTFDISNYVNGHNNFILYFGQKSSSDRYAYVPWISETNKYKLSSATFVGANGFTGILSSGGNALYNTPTSTYGQTVSYDKETGIVTVNNIGSYPLGTSAVLFYLG